MSKDTRIAVDVPKAVFEVAMSDRPGHVVGRISKRGDGNLRTPLIHGARSVLIHARKQQPDRLREWASNLAKTHVHNKAAVAVANELGRIVWAVWHHQRPFALIAKAA